MKELLGTSSPGVRDRITISQGCQGEIKIPENSIEIFLDLWENEQNLGIYTEVLITQIFFWEQLWGVEHLYI